MQDDVNVQTEEEPIKGSIWRLQGIFFEPTRTFQEIRRRPNILLPLILCLLISIAASYLIYTQIDLADIIEQQIRSSGRADQLTNEQIEEQVGQIVDSPFYPIMKWAGPLIGPPLVIVVVSALLLLLIHLTGAETGFLKLFSATSHTYFFYYLVYSSLTVLVFFLSKDPESINLQNPVSTNLGLLIDQKESPSLYKILSSLDLIIIYIIYLLGLGTSIVSERVKVGKGVFLAGLLYVVYVGIGVIWGLFF